MFNEEQAIRQDQLDAERDARQSELENDPIASNFAYVCFLSSSKGRGRKRKYPVEVELFRYSTKQWYTDRRFRWDVFAQDAGVEEEILHERIREL